MPVSREAVAGTARVPVADVAGSAVLLRVLDAAAAVVVGKGVAEAGSAEVEAGSSEVAGREATALATAAYHTAKRISVVPIVRIPGLRR